LNKDSESIFCSALLKDVKMKHKFNTDTKALLNRIDVNSSNAKYDLEKWVINLIQPLEGLNVLDLGCGTGKQIFRFAPYISSKGSILGIDLSESSVEIVNQTAKNKGIDWVRAKSIDLDDCLNYLDDHKFDLIISTYAIYYSKNVEELLIGLKTKLTDNGIIFICGPGDHSNNEIYTIVNSLPSSSDLLIKPIKDFLSVEQISYVSKSYSKHKTLTLENKIIFDSTIDIMQWWRNHNSYVESLDKMVEESILKHFENNEKFVLSKNVLGILFYA
jgi:ubiquinone/menaquinone biosynthesis C-methylase UbiE